MGLAAKYSLKAVQMLVGRGADITAKDNAGFTALAWAKKMEQNAVIKFLRTNGAGYEKSIMFNSESDIHIVGSSVHVV